MKKEGRGKKQGRGRGKETERKDGNRVYQQAARVQKTETGCHFYAQKSFKEKGEIS